MRRIRHILLILFSFLMIGSCSTEKDLIHIGSDRPFKLKNLYLLGDVTPGNDNMDINRPEPLVQDEDDPFIWRYSGLLNEGIFKLCFKIGTWDQPNIHPWKKNEYIGKDPIVDRTMQQPRSRGEDELWVVSYRGMYTLTFNLRDFTYSSEFLGEAPYDLTALFILGATPDNPEMDPTLAVAFKQSVNDANVWIYEGPLVEGVFKIAVQNRDWNQPFIHPTENAEQIGADDIVGRSFNGPYRGEPDNLWRVVKAGNYRLVFDFGTKTYNCIYLGK